MNSGIFVVNDIGDIEEGSERGWMVSLERSQNFVLEFRRFGGEVRVGRIKFIQRTGESSMKTLLFSGKPQDLIFESHLTR